MLSAAHHPLDRRSIHPAVVSFEDSSPDTVRLIAKRQGPLPLWTSLPCSPLLHPPAQLLFFYKELLLRDSLTVMVERCAIQP